MIEALEACAIALLFIPSVVLAMWLAVKLVEWLDGM